eukprot:339360_1
MAASSFIIDKQDKDLLLKVLTNVFTDSTKFGNINFEVISGKFENPTKCMDILFDAGFTKSGVRLLFSNDKRAQLESVHSQLLFMNELDENQYIPPKAQSSIESMDLKHLLREQRLHYQDINPGLKSCDIQECQCLANISSILLFYGSYILGLKQNEQTDEKQAITDDMSVYDSVYSNISPDYNDKNLLNDYHHLTTVHHYQFQQIYDKLISTVYDDTPCDLSQCLSMHRNQRNRNNNDSINHLYCYQSQRDVISQQILDRIHCHLLHTFDVGYKLTEGEKNKIIYHETKNVVEGIEAIVHSKRKVYQNSAAFTRLNGQHHTIHVDDEKTHVLDPYSYGVRYHYWSGSDNSGFYVTKVYEDLREEVLYNDVCGIAKCQWDHLVAQAKIHMLTDIARYMYCHRTGTQAQRYEMRQYQPITEEHLIAMMLYSNHDVLQYIFSATFRREENESDEDLKERHSLFYHLGKMLTETVECVGMKKPVTDTMKVYHATNKNFTFSSMNAHIKVPFSTSLQYAVASNFCTDKGMVLEIEIEHSEWLMPGSTHLMCLDMRWISDFPQEAEIFFLGGRGPFRFNDILKAQGNSNSGYVLGLRRMLSAMTSTSGDFKPDFKEWKLDSDLNCEMEKQIAFRLLAHEFWRYFPNRKHAHPFAVCSDYIKDIVHINCSRVSSMQFFEAETKLHDRYFRDYAGWIDLDVVTTIFPNLERIVYCAVNKTMNYWKNLSMFDHLLGYLLENKDNTKLKKIEVMINEKLEKTMLQSTDFYKEQFNDCGWSVFMVGQYDQSNADYRRMANEFFSMGAQNEQHQALIKDYEESMNKIQKMGVQVPDIKGGIQHKNVGIVFRSSASKI